MVQKGVLRGGNADMIVIPDQEFVRLDKTIELLMRYDKISHCYAVAVVVAVAVAVF